jgi:hypothetical protein
MALASWWGLLGCIFCIIWQRNRKGTGHLQKGQSDGMALLYNNLANLDPMRSRPRVMSLMINYFPLDPHLLKVPSPQHCHTWGARLQYMKLWSICVNHSKCIPRKWKPSSFLWSHFRVFWVLRPILAHKYSDFFLESSCCMALTSKDYAKLLVLHLSHFMSRKKTFFEGREGLNSGLHAC